MPTHLGGGGGDQTFPEKRTCKRQIRKGEGWGEGICAPKDVFAMFSYEIFPKFAMKGGGEREREEGGGGGLWTLPLNPSLQRIHLHRFALTTGVRSHGLCNPGMSLCLVLLIMVNSCGVNVIVGGTRGIGQSSTEVV